MKRRVFLTAAASLLSGCGGPSTTQVSPPKAPSKPLVLSSLEALLPLAGLRWLVLARPREIAALEWLQPAIAMVLDKERLDRFAAVVGFDLRTVPDAVWASYRGDPEDISVELIRHTSDPLVIERSFRDRLSADVVRSVDDANIVRASGRIGQSLHAMASMGPQVVCFQQEGSAERGPCRVATLLALGRLKRTKPVFADEAIVALAKRIGPAPVRAFAPGPFDGELARGARGLLAAATAVGMSASPTERESVLVQIAVAGDFSRSGDLAAEQLVASWNDLASRPLGRLMGLDAPLAPPMRAYASDAVTLVAELDPRKLAKGLADATSNQIREIMR